MIDIRLVPESEMNSMCRLLIKEITAYYQIPENQKKYEEWYLKKFGVMPTEASYMKSPKSI